MRVLALLCMISGTDGLDSDTFDNTALDKNKHVPSRTAPKRTVEKTWRLFAPRSFFLEFLSLP
jgi:hypothetical protein